MALDNGDRDIAYYFLHGSIVDLSTADELYLVVPQRGKLKNIKSIIQNAITVADAVLTVKVNGTSVGTITVTQAASAAGDVDDLDLDTEVLPGDTIEIETDGGSTTATKTGIVVAIDRS